MNTYTLIADMKTDKLHETLTQVVSFMSDPKAAEHVAVRLADRARVLSLGQLVELASSDTGTRASALKTIAGMWGSGGDDELATMTIEDMMGAVNDDAVATGAASFASRADQLLSYLDASASDEKLESILDKAEDALCSQVRTGVLCTTAGVGCFSVNPRCVLGRHGQMCTMHLTPTPKARPLFVLALHYTHAWDERAWSAHSWRAWTLRI